MKYEKNNEEKEREGGNKKKRETMERNGELRKEERDGEKRRIK